MTPNDQRVFRSPKDHSSRFARIDNALLQDRRLSFRSRGVAAYLLSLPADWVFSVSRLAAEGHEGADALERTFKELDAAGYLERTRHREPGTGRIFSRVAFHESPTAEKRHPAPTADLPTAGEPTGRSTGSRWNGSVTNDDKQTTISCAPPAGAAPAPAALDPATAPPVSQKTAEEIYQAYPRKVAKPEAIKAITRAIKTKGADYLLQRTQAYARATQGMEVKFIPYPATWFHKGRYDDPETEWNPEVGKRIQVQQTTPHEAPPPIPAPVGWEDACEGEEELQRFIGRDWATIHRFYQGRIVKRWQERNP